jgi:hypothetical protein
MIELPPEFLNALLTLLIVFANMSRAKQRSGWDGRLPPQSIGFHR